MLSDGECHYSKCRYAEYRSANSNVCLIYLPCQIDINFANKGRYSKTSYKFLTIIIWVGAPYEKRDQVILNEPFVVKKPYNKNDDKIVVKLFVNTDPVFFNQSSLENLILRMQNSPIQKWINKL
jgi:hypothetical protein